MTNSLVIILVFSMKVIVAQTFMEKTKNLFVDKNRKFSGIITYEVIPEKLELNSPKKLNLPTQVQSSYFDFYSKFSYKIDQDEVCVYDDGINMSSMLWVKTGSKDYAVQSNNDEIVKSLSKFPSIKVNETKETKEICGYKCKKINIISDKLTSEAFITTDLNIPNPNWHSQYAEIKGVLLEYTVIKENFRLRYIAINIKPQKFTIADFKLPDGNTKITEADLNQILQKKK